MVATLYLWSKHICLQKLFENKKLAVFLCYKFLILLTFNRDYHEKVISWSKILHDLEQIIWMLTTCRAWHRSWKMTWGIKNVSSWPHFLTNHLTTSVTATYFLIDHSTTSVPAPHFLTDHSTMSTTTLHFLTDHLIMLVPAPHFYTAHLTRSVIVPLFFTDHFTDWTRP